MRESYWKPDYSGGDMHLLEHISAAWPRGYLLLSCCGQKYFAAIAKNDVA